MIAILFFRNEVLNLIDNGALRPLLRIVSDTTDVQCCQNALQAILFLSSSVEQVTNKCVQELIEAKAIPRLIELVLSNSTSTVEAQSNPEKINYSLAVLANLTRTEEGAVELVGKTLPDEAVPKSELTKDGLPAKPTMELLLDRFLNRELILSRPEYSQLEPETWDTNSQDPYQHFAAILMNATQLESGRKFVLRIPQSTGSSTKQPPSVLERLLPQLQGTNPIRRRGISGMLRNCCLEKEAAWWMLNVAKILTPLLYPLMGPEELDLDEKQGMDPDLWLQGPDKDREVDSATRQHLVDAVLLLCATGRKSRQTLRLARTYVVLKYADMVEESEAISERINECVQYLRRDEEGTVEGSSDTMVEELTRTNLKLLPAPQAMSNPETDFDDVD